MIFDVKDEVHFESHLSNECPLHIDVDTNMVLQECFSRVLYCKEFLEKQIGCSPIGNTDGEYRLNTVSFISADGLSREHVAFTGSAYLCDASGKTIDVLR